MKYCCKKSVRIDSFDLNFLVLYKYFVYGVDYDGVEHDDYVCFDNVVFIKSYSTTKILNLKCFYDYFYTAKEVRHLKLKKLENSDRRSSSYPADL